MKHHGNYELLSADELKLDIESGGATREYIARQVKRHKDKHHNEKRHKEKHKTKFKRRKK